MSRLGCKAKVPRTGIEPVRLDQPPNCKLGLFTNSSTGAQALSTGARGGHNPQLAPAWFGRLSIALNPSSWSSLLFTTARFHVCAEEDNHRIKQRAMVFREVGRILNERISQSGDRKALETCRNRIRAPFLRLPILTIRV